MSGRDVVVDNYLTPAEVPVGPRKPALPARHALLSIMTDATYGQPVSVEKVDRLVDGIIEAAVARAIEVVDEQRRQPAKALEEVAVIAEVAAETLALCMLVEDRFARVSRTHIDDMGLSIVLDKARELRGKAERVR